MSPAAHRADPKLARANISTRTSVKGCVTSPFQVNEPGDAVKSPNALLHGTLDALVLKTLADGPRHGYAIARYIEDTTAEAVAIVEGSLYPALYRMERRGWIKAEWSQSDIGKDIKRYALTPKGRTELRRKSAQWDGLTSAVAKVMRA